MKRREKLIWAVLILVCAVAAPFAPQWPDGLEYALHVGGEHGKQ